MVHGRRRRGRGLGPQRLRVFHEGPVLVVKVNDLGGRREVYVEAVVSELVAGLAAEAALEVLGGDAGDVQRELLRAVPVLVDADGVVVAGAEPLLDLLPRLDLAVDDVVPRQGGRTRKCGDLILR